MNPGALEPPVRWWQAELEINQPSVHYRFILQAEDGVWMYSAAGPSVQEPVDIFDFRLLADYTPPGWLASSVFYQIFLTALPMAIPQRIRSRRSLNIAATGRVLFPGAQSHPKASLSYCILRRRHPGYHPAPGLPARARGECTLPEPSLQCIL